MSTKWSCKDESQNGVVKLSREDESQRQGRENKRFGGICNKFPKGSTKIGKNTVRNG